LFRTFLDFIASAGIKIGSRRIASRIFQMKPLLKWSAPQQGLADKGAGFWECSGPMIHRSHFFALFSKAAIVRKCNDMPATVSLSRGRLGGAGLTGSRKAVRKGRNETL
jgi:hypothetical protein